ncbi:MAG: glycoside hydrolase family 5 protein [Clostridia bacterium]|nr:glycoside hydrolase family 5 protein [Clostridia bacterium]
MQNNKTDYQPKSEEQIDKNSIKYNGWLRTRGSELQNQHGEKIQLKGLSSHGIQWFPEVITYDNLKELKDNWNINVFRIAMYTDPNVDGYIAHPEESKEQVKQIVEYAKKLDLYVIIDWHILSDNNPQTYQEESIKFFDEMSKEYSSTPNVLYEICNEPNGYKLSWSENVKPYAEELIRTIRRNCSKSLIIIGTPEWCTDIKSAADNPIKAPNIIYSCHFYAGTHKELLREDIDYCLGKNIPIFISECGITNSTGNGPIYEKSFNEWYEYINEKGLSWIFWSFSNKAEGSSILKPEYKPTVENNEETTESVNINEYLTETGEIVKSLLTK